MPKSKRSRARKPAAPRSKKAGRPPKELPQSAQARRRRKSARSAYGTGTTLYQSNEVRHVLPGVSRPLTRKAK
jgi:hypothetical protein